MAKDDRPGYVSINGSGNTFEYFNRSDDYIKQLLIANLGEKRKSMFTVVFLTMIYATIFLTGVIGNLSTCIVIWKNTYMHTVTNYYLFTLAISDVMTLLLESLFRAKIKFLRKVWSLTSLWGLNKLICNDTVRRCIKSIFTEYGPSSFFVALPPEVYSIWEAYPWRFGQSFCILKSFIMEMTSYSSVLTITGFTVERYLSICHPMKLQHCCHISRAKRCIVLICVVSILSALPYPVHTMTFYYLSDPHSGQHIPDSLVCNIPQKWTGRMIIVFQLSTFVYFVLPMAILSLMYILIGIKLHRTELRTKYDTQYGQATATKARRAILKMLVAVVVAFFICWAPFHAQRLMTLYVTNWNARLLEIQGHLFYLSGILYFFSSTVNPILYNVMSRKFRRAFKRTLCRCFVGANNLPSFYMLKAKFINHDLNVPHSRESDIPNMSDNKDFRIVTYYNNDKRESSKYNHSGDKCSTKETLINKTSESTSGKSHAHSDSDLHALCRHKRCSDRRHSALNRRRNGLVNSFHDIDDLRKEHTLFDYQTAAKLRLLDAEPLTHAWQSTV